MERKRTGVIIDIKRDTGLVLRSDNTVRFYNDIRKFEVMSREEERKTLLQYKYGNEQEKEEAKRKIIETNQRLIVSFAKKYSDTDTLMDYVNEANMGLIEALENFDPEKFTNRFFSYATWYIKRAINAYNNQNKEIVRRTNQRKTFYVIAKAKDKFLQENGRNATPAELVEFIRENYNVNIVEESDVYDIRYTYIDDNSEADETFNYDLLDYDIITATYNDYEKESNDDFFKEMIGSLLNVLSPREQTVIKMRFGIEEVNGVKRVYEANEVAEVLGITSERVRQMENSILARLKAEYIKRVARMKMNI